MSSLILELAMKRLVAIFILSLFSINAYALTCNDVNGSYVYSSDGTYLGFFGNQFSSDWINGNPYGSESATHPYALASFAYFIPIRQRFSLIHGINLHLR